MSGPVERAADAAAVGSIAAAGISKLVQWNQYIQLVAGVVAIVAGLFAIAVHWKRLTR